jgi:F420-dependent oxidoreductase-like protein
MELCLMIEGQEGVTWPQWKAIAEACERYGVPALFRSDHYENLDGHHPERAALDAWATLSALAAVTSSLRLGTLVSPATFRHPSVLAKMVVTVDHVSGGRIELGLGAGWHESEHEAYGFPFPATRVRMEVLEEQLQIVHGAWSEDEPFSFTGKHYELKNLRAQPKPVQKPHPPLIMGGVAGPRSAALAAQFADEYNTVFTSPEDARARGERVADACSSIGREPIPLSVMTGFVVGSDDDDLRARAARVAAVRGSDPSALLSDPPAGWIVGTVERAAEQLAALRDAGVHRVMCQHLAHDDLDFIELMARELAPRVA